MKSLAFAFALLFTTPAFALDLSREQPTTQIVQDQTCRQFESEAAQVARAGWSVKETIAGEAAQIFLKVYNDTDPKTNWKADKVVLFTKVGVPRTGILFVTDKGCVVAPPVFVNDAELKRLRGSAA